MTANRKGKVMMVYGAAEKELIHLTVKQHILTCLCRQAQEIVSLCRR